MTFLDSDDDDDDRPGPSGPGACVATVPPHKLMQGIVY